MTLDLVVIPEGQFQMGSPGDEIDRRDTEGPQHLVTIESFLMGKYPVTQAQWWTVAAWPKVKWKLKSHPSRSRGDNRPVEQVSWLEAGGVLRSSLPSHRPTVSSPQRSSLGICLQSRDHNPIPFW